MSHPQNASEPTITITCIYCGHTWTESIAKLEAQDRVVYRETGGDPPGRETEYLIACPECSRRMTVTVRVKGA